MNITELLGSVRVKSPVPEGVAGVDESYARLRTRIFDSGVNGAVIKMLGIYKKIAVAASLILILAVGGLIHFAVRPAGTDFLVESNISGRVKTVILSDGTSVKVNVGSKLIYPKKFTASKREVFLVGEAYFEVTKNKHKPFVVRAGDVGITVLGTRFNVKAFGSDENIVATLLEGSVKLDVANSRYAKVMKPNDVFTYNQITQKASLENSAAAGQNVVWLSGKIVMNDMTVEDICKELERVYNKRFVVADKEIAAKKITGEYYYEEKLTSFLEVLRITANLSYTINDDMVIITKGK